jgi:integrase
MHIETISRKGGRKYRAIISVNGRKRRSPVFKRVIDAQLWAERLEQGYSLNEIPAFEKAAQDWMECHCALYNQQSSIERNKELLKELLPVFGKRKLNQIETRDIEKHLRDLKTRGLGANSLRLRVALLKSVFNWHMKRGIQVFNPCLAIKPFKEREEPFGHWSLEQAETFLAYTAKKYASQKKWIHLLYALALNTGLRWSEVIALDWSNIDLKRKQITVSQIIDTVTGQVRKSTKSGRIRHIGVNDALFDILSIAKDDQISGLVFKDLNANPIDRRNFMTRHYKPDMIAAGVTRIRFHDLRHSYATLYMLDGGNIFDLQKLLGHSTVVMTDRYAHFSKEHVSQKSNFVNVGLNRLRVIEGGFKKAN